MRHGDIIKKIFDGSEDKEDFTNEVKVLLTEKNVDIVPLAQLLGILIENHEDEPNNESN